MEGFTKIPVANPVVTMNGDEMARVMWAWIQDELIVPFLDLEMIEYDLGLPERDRTDDAITLEAAKAIAHHKVGIKCATITPNPARMVEFNLKRMYRSPNGTIRNYLGGAIFREAIIIPSIPRLVTTWTKSIVISRHAFGDQYKATDFITPGAGSLTMKYTPAEGVDAEETEYHIADLPDCKSCAMGMYNTEDSIRAWAELCFEYALNRNIPLYLSTKRTILKAYDGLFTQIFAEIYEEKYRERYEAMGIHYEHQLIDAMVASALKWSGGFLWACKNYDGDVQSDSLAQGYGSLGLMRSVLLSKDGACEAEAAHGTVTRHYRLYQEGKGTSTNPIASIYAWTTGLLHRAKLDENEALRNFCIKLEQACIQAVDDGIYTKDLAICKVNGAAHLVKDGDYVMCLDYIQAVKERLITALTH